MMASQPPLIPTHNWRGFSRDAALELTALIKHLDVANSDWSISSILLETSKEASTTEVDRELSRDASRDKHIDNLGERQQQARGKVSGRCSHGFLNMLCSQP